MNTERRTVGPGADGTEHLIRYASLDGQERPRDVPWIASQTGSHAKGEGSREERQLGQTPELQKAEDWHGTKYVTWKW